MRALACCVMRTGFRKRSTPPSAGNHLIALSAWWPPRAARPTLRNLTEHNTRQRAFALSFCGAWLFLPWTNVRAARYRSGGASAKVHGVSPAGGVVLLSGELDQGGLHKVRRHEYCVYLNNWVLTRPHGADWVVNHRANTLDARRTFEPFVETRPARSWRERRRQHDQAMQPSRALRSTSRLWTSSRLRTSREARAAAR
jgi:hypothetical protein